MQGQITAIDPQEAARYMGCTTSPLPEDMAARIEAASAQIMAAARPRVIYREFSFYNATYQLADTCCSLPGKDAGRYLSDCSGCILLAATLGSEADALIRQAQIGHMAEAVVLDSCASCAIENVCDNAEREIVAALSARGLYTTDRFSPGYGDVPLSLQKDFCLLLDTVRKIGLSVSSGGLLTPVKSVTAIIGISSQPQPARLRGCAHCTLRDTCPYKKGGTTCGKK